MRGTVSPRFPGPPGPRITPACAGNRDSKGEILALVEDHPRVCGEQTAMDANIGIEVGSPPRVRGTAMVVLALACPSRITPACAGNSCIPYALFLARQDHPRVCGEQRTSSPGASRTRGSPPRVRGTGLTGGETVYAQRITPACAGNRKNQPSAYTSERDHPRVCGEQWVLNHARLPVSGSPPRVRGTASISL